MLKQFMRPRLTILLGGLLIMMAAWSLVALAGDEAAEPPLQQLAQAAAVEGDSAFGTKAKDAKSDKRKKNGYLTMAFSVIGGLGIFLIGMRNMSDGMQAVAGNRLRRMVNAVTDNRFMATGIGTAVTCVVQSSSITTVLVVGLVNSGLMLLHQAIGVIMGANIGTTITGWILVLKIGQYGLPLIGLSVPFYLFSKRDRVRYLALVMMGVGMIFFGLLLMKQGFKPMTNDPTFKAAFEWFNAGTYLGVLKCAMVGCILTFIVQSSSATLGITIGLAATGAIPFQTAAALVLGENIGTTITAWLASFATTTVAKRAAYAHVLFNLVGVVWITAIFHAYMGMVDRFVAWEMGQGLIDLNRSHENYAQIVTFGIASVHTGFNVANTLLFLPFVRRFAVFLEWLIPDRRVKEVPHLTNFDMRMVESPVIGIEASRGEINKMSNGVQEMLDWTRHLCDSEPPDQALVQKVFHSEQIMDNVQQEVIQFMTNLLAGQVPHSIIEEGRQQLRVVDEYESISDYVSAVLKSHLRLRNADQRFTETERGHLQQVHDQVAGYVKMVGEAFEHRHGDVLSQAQTKSDTITHRIKDLRDEHLVRLTEQKIDPVRSMCYTATLNAYRKVKDHALNIAEALAGGK